MKKTISSSHPNERIIDLVTKGLLYREVPRELIRSDDILRALRLLPEHIIAKRKPNDIVLILTTNVLRKIQMPFNLGDCCLVENIKIDIEEMVRKLDNEVSTDRLGYFLDKKYFVSKPQNAGVSCSVLEASLLYIKWVKTQSVDDSFMDDAHFQDGGGNSYSGFQVGGVVSCDYHIASSDALSRILLTFLTVNESHAKRETEDQVSAMNLLNVLLEKKDNFHFRFVGILRALNILSRRIDLRVTRLHPQLHEFYELNQESVNNFFYETPLDELGTLLYRYGNDFSKLSCFAERRDLSSLLRVSFNNAKIPFIDKREGYGSTSSSKNSVLKKSYKTGEDRRNPQTEDGKLSKLLSTLNAVMHNKFVEHLSLTNCQAQNLEQFGPDDSEKMNDYKGIQYQSPKLDIDKWYVVIYEIKHSNSEVCSPVAYIGQYQGEDDDNKLVFKFNDGEEDSKSLNKNTTVMSLYQFKDKYNDLNAYILKHPSMTEISNTTIAVAPPNTVALANAVSPPREPVTITSTSICYSNSNSDEGRTSEERAPATLIRPRRKRGYEGAGSSNGGRLAFKRHRPESIDTGKEGSRWFERDAQKGSPQYHKSQFESISSEFQQLSTKMVSSFVDTKQLDPNDLETFDVLQQKFRGMKVLGATAYQRDPKFKEDIQGCINAIRLLILEFNDMQRRNSPQ
ncbi:hypothetical protein DID73_02000 [Candidatus Marinamargulisbacteria bacterium SCGC AG-343-K17]|nr:hypothetical protein DID73_02000 [Candidatus Marinamargulisbacteria bacterium SCGC AG-343-K17]